MTDTRLTFLENLLNELLNQKELEDYFSDIRTALAFLSTFEQEERRKFSEDQMKTFNVVWPDDST